MIDTPVILKALCSGTLTPLNKNDAVQIQNVRASIIKGLTPVMCEVYGHGHAFILETIDHFLLHKGESSAILPEAPTQLGKDLGGKNYKEFMLELKLYNTYM